MIDRKLNYGRKIIKQFLSKSSPYKDVLDIGAGLGEDLRIAQDLQIGNVNLIAIENYPEYTIALKECRISVFSCNLERDPIPLPDNSIDIVIANQVLEHTKEIFWIFHEISRTLRVGGRVIIGVPNLASFHNRLLLLCGKQPTQIKTASAHIRGFTKADMLHFLEECFPGGYKLLDFKGSNFYPFPPILAKPLSTIFPTLSWGIFFLLEKQKEYGSEFIAYPTSNKLETNFWLGKD